MPAFESLPYRPCTGLAVFNRSGRVFIGRRLDGPEHVDMLHAWQMPQGGIDPGEDPWPAALVLGGSLLAFGLVLRRSRRKAA